MTGPRLASLAVSPDQSRGRRHQEDNVSIDAFALDRRRVLHCSAFRRLEYKTQVFLTQIDDHLRTRLTHTLEVAEIARTLARELCVNEDLAEVIALAHDLGHPPFGHAGEAELSALMAEHGGFEHNLHTLRVVDEMEHPYPHFHGLNLTFEVREGLVKHITVHDKPQAEEADDESVRELYDSGPWPTVEAQIVCVADRIAYDLHDIEDALGSDLLHEDQLMTVPLWRKAAHPIRSAFGEKSIAAIRRPILDNLRQHLLRDCATEAMKRGHALRGGTVEDVRRADRPIVTFSNGLHDRDLNTESDLAFIEDLLLTRVYRHDRLVKMDADARRIIRELFGAYVDRPELLPARYARRIAKQGRYRVICDYIAGMTDRFCQGEHARLFAAGASQ